MHVASFSPLSGHRGAMPCRAMDGYKGYAKLYAPERDGVPRLREAACWAHLWRDFHVFWASNKSETAREALDRIGKLYDIERDGEPMCAIGSSTMASGGNPPRN